MKPIKLQKKVFEVPFAKEDGSVAFTLEYHRSDKTTDNMLEELKKLEELDKKFKKEKGEQWTTTEEERKIIRPMIDSMFGEGAFDKLYDFDDDVRMVFFYVFAAAEQVQEEIKNSDLKKIEDKYLK
ncbi:hypothetical protein [Lactococcus petauri]|uniref:hypothetical protein n=1 Tax=Lactococcus petauri TaxID=1940789 RepID=UPI001F06D64D|nr:hypothetical protein [Lactococcus petauri]MCH1713142.1 hypothetical protein [Lactococcus petauri]